MSVLVSELDRTVATPVDQTTGASLASILTRQVSSDELIDSHDVQNVHEIIVEGREEEDQTSESDYSTDLIARGHGGEILTINLYSILCKAAINFVLPFFNGVMIGIGEILAHEVGFRYGFRGARVVPERRHAAQESRKQQSSFL